MALTLRQEIVEAVSWRQEGKMLRLARAIFKAQITVHALRESSLGLLDSESPIWNGQAAEYARRAVEKWRLWLVQSPSVAGEDIFSLSPMQRHGPKNAQAAHKSRVTRGHTGGAQAAQ